MAWYYVWLDHFMYFDKQSLLYILKYFLFLHKSEMCINPNPLGYFEDFSPLGGPPPLRSRQLMDRLTWKLAQS